jgi:hypothetical protein
VRNTFVLTKLLAPDYHAVRVTLRLTRTDPMGTSTGTGLKDWEAVRRFERLVGCAFSTPRLVRLQQPTSLVSPNEPFPVPTPSAFAVLRIPRPVANRSRIRSTGSVLAARAGLAFDATLAITRLSVLNLTLRSSGSGKPFTINQGDSIGLENQRGRCRNVR